VKRTINILVALCSIPLLLLGTKAMFFPASTLEMFELKPMGLFGFNTMRGAIGGMLIGGASMILIGLWTKNTTWFLSTILIVSIILAGRIMSVIFDGWTNTAIPALVIEVLIIGVMLLASKKSDASNEMKI
jgi:prolipoprotein diacylglyceryltransferase